MTSWRNVTSESPCHHCETRSVGCHSQCERYLGWSESEREKKAVIHAAKANDLRYLDHVRKTVRRARKKRG